MQHSAITISLAGDLVLDEPDAGYWLSGIAPALRASDWAIGHLEVPHTAHGGSELQGDVPAPGAPLENLPALAEAGFNMVSLAGNHIADCGAQGIADTRAGLDVTGVTYCGAGPDLASARAPAWATVKGARIALLSYNCVGPENSWATETRAGCAYLPIATSDGSPIAPAAPLQNATPQAYAILEEDIAALRQEADLVLVALHKGLVHRPAVLAPYERAISQAAIKAGADAVLGSHAHIIRGIEFYDGKPIFHGLGNACVVTSALSAAQDHPKRREWAEKRKALFGFEPDPTYTLAPFHPEAVHGFIAQLLVAPGETLRVQVVPIHVEAPGRPVLATAEKVKEIHRYIEKITRDAGLPSITIAADGMVGEAQ